MNNYFYLVILRTLYFTHANAQEVKMPTLSYLIISIMREVRSEKWSTSYKYVLWTSVHYSTYGLFIKCILVYFTGSINTQGKI